MLHFNLILSSVLYARQVVANAEKLGMTPEEAANLFDDLDDDQSGELTR
jgi:hypothetical protein